MYATHLPKIREKMKVDYLLIGLRLGEYNEMGFDISVAGFYAISGQCTCIAYLCRKIKNSARNIISPKYIISLKYVLT